MKPEKQRRETAAWDVSCAVVLLRLTAHELAGSPEAARLAGIIAELKLLQRDLAAEGCPA